MITGILVGLAGSGGDGEAGTGAVAPGTQCSLKQEVSGQTLINGVWLGVDENIPVFVTEQTTDDKVAPPLHCHVHHQRDR